MSPSLDLNLIWNQTLENIRNDESSDIPNMTIENFLEDTVLLNLDNQFAYVKVEDIFAKETLTNFKSQIQQYLQAITSTNYEIEFLDPTDLEKIENLEPEDKSDVAKNIIFEKEKTNLNEDYTFNNFVVGAYNKSAYRAAQGVLSSPGNIYNPFIIYSNPGMGKTHLVQAIGNEIRKERPNMRILYIYSKDLIKDFTNLCKKEKAYAQYDQEWFDNKYQDIDVLIIDDIQMLKDAVGTANQFFDIYNNLTDKNKQIIITSDVRPEELKGMEERLVSRFKSGLTVKIDPLDVQTGIDILKRKLAYHSKTNLGDAPANEIISDEALEFIAKNYSKDVRELEGALRTLMFSIIDCSQEDFTMDLVYEAFKDTKPLHAEENITEDDILAIVCDYYNQRKKDVTGKSRMKTLATPRHVAIYLTRTMLETPFEKIGKMYGNRDHSTIMSSYNKIKNYVDDNDQKYVSVISEIQSLLKT